MVNSEAIVTDEMMAALVDIDEILVKIPCWEATAVLAALSELYKRGTQ